MFVHDADADAHKNDADARWVGKLPECGEERGEEAGCGGIGDCQQVVIVMIIMMTLMMML